MNPFDALVLVAEADQRRASSVSAADIGLTPKHETPSALRVDSNGRKRKTSSSSATSASGRRASEPTFRTAFAAMNLAAATTTATSASTAVSDSVRAATLPTTKREIERLLLDTARQRQHPLVRSVTRPGM
jgi:hypothetical protein